MAGFKVIGAVDSDPVSVDTYRINHPEVHTWKRDIRELSLSEVKRKLGMSTGSLDLLAGCPPCQGFSNIRTHRSCVEVSDPRNDLIFEFLRFVKGLEPRAIMLENVPGLAENGRFKKFCNRLRKMGYVVNYRILNAANYGVPQRRYRLICLAGRNNKIDFAESVSPKKTVRDTIFDLPEPGNTGDLLHDLPEKRTEKVMSIIRRIPKNGGSRMDLGYHDQLPCHKRCNGFKDIYGRMKWDDVSPTITSGCFNPSKGRFLHPEQDRAITLREAALFQSFPKEYKFSIIGGKNKLGSMIGNALPAVFIKSHATKVAEYLSRNGSRK